MNGLSDRTAGCLLMALITVFGTLFPATAFSQGIQIEKLIPRRARSTVVDMSVAELRDTHGKELSHVEFNPGDEQDEELSTLLEKVGGRVRAFFRDLSNTTSKEDVRMERIHHGFETHDFLSKSYYYLIMPGSGLRETSWVEDRTDRNFKPVDLKAISGFCISAGYAFMSMYLHPDHQPNSRFRYLGRETGKPRSHVIAFAQKPQAADYQMQYIDVTRGTSTRFLVQGFVWVEPDSFEISRIRTFMMLPETPTALINQITDISYAKTPLGNDVKRDFWLPGEVTVRWELPDQVFLNRHRYSEYRLFAVSSDYVISKPKPAP